MTLTATQPDRQLLDSLSLDAAWERASQLELEITRLKAVAKANHEAYTAVCSRWHKMTTEIGGLMTSLRGSPDRPVGSIVTELSRILNEDKK